MSRVKEIIQGTRFERLAVISREPISQNGRARWRCKCDCGKLFAVNGKELRSGNTKSCGCLKNDKASQRLYRHGLSKTVISNTWKRMIQRCFNPSNPKFPRYGGRGIKPCEYLRASPVNLLLLVGQKPTTRHSLGRIDNELGYFCGQCPECIAGKWAMNIEWQLPKPQARNRSITKMLEVDGVIKPVAEWAEESGIGYATFNTRVARGFNPFKKVIRGKPITFNGQSKTIAEWAEEGGISYQLAFQRLRVGKNPFEKRKIGRPPST